MSKQVQVFHEPVEFALPNQKGISFFYPNQIVFIVFADSVRERPISIPGQSHE